MERQARFNVLYVLFAILAVLALQRWWQEAQTLEVVPYSEFEQLLASGRIAEVTVGDRQIIGKLKKAEGGKQVAIANRMEPELAERLEKYGVPYTRNYESTLLRDILSWVVPALVFFALWMFLARRMAGQQGGVGGMLSIGKSRAKVYVEHKTGVTFADVAGVDEAKAELQEVVEFLKDPSKYGRLGARVPKGILLVGPPGTGKTLLARAVAGEAGVAFFSISGSEFVEMFVGVGAARVRDLFEQARKAAPAIVFIDEIDAIGRSRGGVMRMGANDEREQTLNQLLAEIDGFKTDTSAPVIIMAATNRPEVLDPALLRAGRFDRQIAIGNPDLIGRVQILKIHSKGVKLAADFDMEQAARMTAGFSGADLENAMNEAALGAGRRNAANVTLNDFEAAIERVIAGSEKKSRVMNEQERTTVAYHESGHALVAELVPHGEPVSKISIVPHSRGALGYTMQMPTEDRYLLSIDELKDRIAVMLGGRAGEMVEFGTISTGASDDIQRATELARRMVTEFGMSEKLGSVRYAGQQLQYLAGSVEDNSQLSPGTRQVIDSEVERLVTEQYVRAQALLKEHRPAHKTLAQLLLNKETVSGSDVKEALENSQTAGSPALPGRLVA